MNAIRQKVHLFAMLSGLGGIAFAAALTDCVSAGACRPGTTLAGTTILTGLFLGIWIHQRQRLHFAMLITSNEILQIQTATVDAWSGLGPGLPIKAQDAEIIVSCFGILLGQEIIKFNVKGVRLNTVEIGPRLVTLEYGQGQQVSKISIMHKGIGTQELERVSERFRFETGVSPVIVE